MARFTCSACTSPSGSRRESVSGQRCRSLPPAVFVGLTLLLRKTRWGILVRAATQDREMAGALGVNQRWLFTGVFALGALLAGFGGASAIPREPATLGVDLSVLSDAFVVV